MRPVFDNRAFIEWLDNQPPTHAYQYENCKDCLIAQYLKFRGFENVTVDSKYAYMHGTFIDGDNRLLPTSWDDVAEARPRTFGAAAVRARKALLK